MDKMNELLASYLLEEFDDMVRNAPLNDIDYHKEEWERKVEKFREKLVKVLKE